jgi:hypothetical protein
MTAQQLRAWPGQGGDVSNFGNFGWVAQAAQAAQAAHAAVWWSGVAALLCIALLASLQAVLQRSVDQGQMRRTIYATQLTEARHCRTLAGGRAQESCLIALNETAHRAAETHRSTARSSP